MGEDRVLSLRDQTLDHSIGANIAATGAPPHFGKRYFSAAAAGFATMEDLVAGMVGAGRISSDSPVETLLETLAGCRPERGMAAGRPLLEGELLQLRVDGCGRAERVKLYMRPHRLAAAAYVMEDLAATLVWRLFGDWLVEADRAAMVAEILRRHRIWPIRLISLAVPATWGRAAAADDASDAPPTTRVDWRPGQLEIETYHDSAEGSAMSEAGQVWTTDRVREIARSRAAMDLTQALIRSAVHHGLSLCYVSRDLFPRGVVPGDGADTSVSVCTPPDMDIPTARRALGGFFDDLAGIRRIPPLMPSAVEWCFAGMGPGRRAPSMLDGLTVKIPDDAGRPAEVFLVVKPVWLAELM